MLKSSLTCFCLISFIINEIFENPINEFVKLEDMFKVYLGVFNTDMDIRPENTFKIEKILVVSMHNLNNFRVRICTRYFILFFY